MACAISLVREGSAGPILGPGTHAFSYALPKRDNSP